VAADTELYMEHPGGNLVISFTRALGSPRRELERFLEYDTTTAFVLGVPPLVEYGYSNEQNCLFAGFEWMHGIPMEFVETISRINTWRAGSRVSPLDDWVALESYILGWRPRPTVPDREKSNTENIARLVVQESWRQVVLIYFYMVCHSSPCFFS
jgi:hypothetical protein